MIAESAEGEAARRGLAGQRIAAHDVVGYRITDAMYGGGLTIPRHSHARAAFTFVTRGGFQELVRRSTVACGPGMLHIRPSEEPHANQFAPDGARVLIVDMPRVMSPEMRALGRMLERPGVVHDGVVATIAGELQWELHHGDVASALAMQGLVLALFARVLRAKRTEDAARGTTAARLDAARDYIDAHFTRALLLADLAGMAGLHPAAFARAFRRRFEVTPWQYQRRRRIAWAKAELTRGERSISEIAHEAGFADHAHLTRAFRTAEGMVPSAVRQRRPPRDGTPA